jgi:hypothetical protein
MKENATRFFGRRSRWLLGLALAALSGAPVVQAHEIPSDVLVQVYFRPQGTTATLLVRVPLAAMRDLVWPLASADGTLDLARIEQPLRDAAAIWIGGSVRIVEESTALPPPRLVSVRVAQPSSTAFRSFEEALRHLEGSPLPAGTAVLASAALFDVRYEVAIASDRSRFAIDTGVGRLGLRVRTVLRFLVPGGTERAFEYHGEAGLIQLDPRWHQAFGRFVFSGFAHILDGIDHLLFLACLVLPFRRLRPLIWIVTSFTAAHSITLIASAFGYVPDALWFPPLIEMVIAVSIVYMAVENILGLTAVSRRLVVTFLFGLVHGFGFSFSLRETLQFAGSHVLTSLLAFNVGVEIGQVLVLLILVPALSATFGRLVPERLAVIVLSAFVTHTAWHWTADRFETVRAFDWPAWSAATALVLVRWVIGLTLVGWGVWIASSRWRLTAPAAEGGPGAKPPG